MKIYFTSKTLMALERKNQNKINDEKGDETEF